MQNKRGADIDDLLGGGTERDGKDQPVGRNTGRARLAAVWPHLGESFHMHNK